MLRQSKPASGPRSARRRSAPTTVEHLNKLEAAAERLSRSFVDAQHRLAEANRVRFRERLDEVTHRIAGAARARQMKLMPKFKPGDRVVIARGPGAGLAGVVVQPRGPCRDDEAWVIFDREPGTRYCAPVAGLDPEAIPKKPPRPSVQRARKAKRA